MLLIFSFFPLKIRDYFLLNNLLECGNRLGVAQTRRAGPRVPPKGNTYHKATEETQIVGTDVLGCPVSFDVTR